MSKVLMLGWEFPPLFSGGLGIATYGMVRAMSPKASIRLIIPNVAPVDNLENVSIKGLNKINSDEINIERFTYNLSQTGADVKRIPLTLSPYHHRNKEFEKLSNEELNLLKEGKHSLEFFNTIFSDPEVYGANIMEKIVLYGLLAAELAMDGDFDVIHAHDWITYPGGMRIKENSGKPLVLHVHSLETDRSGVSCRNFIYDLEKKAMDMADKIIAVSQYTKDQLCNLYQVDPSKISVVHNGVEPVAVVRKNSNIKDKLVVFLGRLTHQKGPDFLIETAEKVSRVYPRVKFAVAGTGDQFTHALHSSAYKKLGSKFIFTGFLSKSKVNELLSMADVYFMPSVSEPFGLTALEATQFGVPTVISKQSGAAEVLTSALKADFWDTDKYANYIYALLRYGALREELTKRTGNDIQGLTWDLAAEKVLRIYDEVRNN